ncbi:MAG: hypothetical protein H0W56_03415, partial [Acidothermales bacterium]|nr:hypothetical protein [Acidothermales bacterium]
MTASREAFAAALVVFAAAAAVDFPARAVDWVPRPAERVVDRAARFVVVAVDDVACCAVRRVVRARATVASACLRKSSVARCRRTRRTML